MLHLFVYFISNDASVSAATPDWCAVFSCFTYPKWKVFFLQSWMKVRLLLLLNITDRNQTSRNGRVSTHSDVQHGSANWQASFSGRGNVWKKLPFLGHIAKKFRRPIILQLNIEGLTANKINVLYYLALHPETLVILLQETHCTDAEKLVLPSYELAGS